MKLRIAEGMHTEVCGESIAYSELSSALGEFLSILTEPNIEALQDGDRSAHSSFADLRSRPAMSPDSRRDVLVEHIDDLTTEWPAGS